VSGAQSSDAINAGMGKQTEDDTQNREEFHIFFKLIVTQIFYRTIV